MLFKNFYDRNDPNDGWRFDDEPASVTLMGETVGCQSCCNKNIAVSKADLQKHIESLRKALEKAETLLQSL